MRRSVKAALTTVVFAGATLSAAAPAMAAAPAGNAPGCVTVWQTTGRITKTGHARNDCDYTMHLKIVWAHGADGDCFTVQPGESIYSTVARGVRSFDGADVC
ncbi:MAG: hypothetical protein HOY71_11350 [Nonomuraea sp.]|nr:hypothetical protein [Nonomuraea sp.]